MFEIVRYSEERKSEWNDFVERSKNGTFLIDRNYMDYHSDRFADFSLMFYLKGKLYAVLPANVKDNTVYSHQGLTYGGLIMGEDAKAANTCVLFAGLNDYMHRQGISRVVYKAIPDTMPFLFPEVAEDMVEFQVKALVDEMERVKEDVR